MAINSLVIGIEAASFALQTAHIAYLQRGREMNEEDVYRLSRHLALALTSIYVTRAVRLAAVRYNAPLDGAREAIYIAAAPFRAVAQSLGLWVIADRMGEPSAFEYGVSKTVALVPIVPDEDVASVWRSWPPRAELATAIADLYRRWLDAAPEALQPFLEDAARAPEGGDR